MDESGAFFGGSLHSPILETRPEPIVFFTSVAPPDAATFAQLLFPGASGNRATKQLHALLLGADADKPLEEREVMLIRIAKWVRSGAAAPAIPDVHVVEPPPTRRFRLLVMGLEAVPALAGRLATLVRSILAEQSAEGFFAKTGIPGDQGLLAETTDRLAARLLPEPLDEKELTQLAARMFPGRLDIRWLATLSPELVLRLILALRKIPDETGRLPLNTTFDPTRQTLHDAPLGFVSSIPPSMDDEQLARKQSTWAPLRIALLDAILLLAARVSAAGLRDAIRDRSGIPRLRESPFFRLPRSVDALLATPRNDLDTAGAWADDCRALVQECRDASAAVFEHLEQAGVSVDVVYRLELIERSLKRIELLLAILVPQSSEQLAQRAVGLLASLLAERRRDHSLTDIVRTNTRLFARKIIERTGQTGEHYITVTPGEYFKMLLSAWGGGFITGFTILFKFLFSGLQRPPLQDGVLASINYAGSFITMQFLGFTLATKQPSMTAAVIAGSIKEGGDNREAVVRTTARVVRSQLAAATGNVTMVIPSAVGIYMAYQHYLGKPLIPDEAYAQKIIASFHPTESGTIAFAALTGVILWLSGLAAGWLENWAVYRRLPEAIAEHWMRRFVGHRVTSWASRVFARNISGIGGNIAVGTMLGMTASIGQFAGLPLEVRHVTLSTGQLTMAVYKLGLPTIYTPEFQMAVAGIAIILTMNLGVSFAFAIVVALRAREVSFWEAIKLVWAIFVGFLRSPFRFFLPVESGATASSGGH